MIEEGAKVSALARSKASLIWAGNFAFEEDILIVPKCR